MRGSDCGTWCAFGGLPSSIWFSLSVELYMQPGAVASKVGLLNCYWLIGNGTRQWLLVFKRITSNKSRRKWHWDWFFISLRHLVLIRCSQVNFNVESFVGDTTTDCYEVIVNIFCLLQHFKSYERTLKSIVYSCCFSKNPQSMRSVFHYSLNTLDQSMSLR